MDQPSRQFPPYMETGSAKLARRREEPSQPPVQITILVVAATVPPTLTSYARACVRAHRLPARSEMRQVRQIVGGRS